MKVCPQCQFETDTDNSVWECGGCKEHFMTFKRARSLDEMAKDLSKIAGCSEQETTSFLIGLLGVIASRVTKEGEDGS